MWHPQQPRADSRPGSTSAHTDALAEGHHGGEHRHEALAIRRSWDRSGNRHHQSNACRGLRLSS